MNRLPLNNSFLILIVLLLISTNSLAQTNDTTSQDVVAITDVSTILEDDYSKIREIKQELNNLKPLYLIGNEVNALYNTFKEFNENIEDNKIEELALRHVQSLSRLVEDIDQKLITPESDISKYSILLSESNTQLDEMILQIQSVRVSDESEILSEALDSTLVKAIGEMQQLKLAYNDSLTISLELKGKISEMLIQIEEYKENFKQVSQIELENLFKKKNPSFFNEWRTKEDTISLINKVINSFKLSAKEIISYLKHGTFWHYSNIILFISVFLFTISLAIYNKKWAETFNLSDTESFLLSKPISNGLLIYLLISFWFEIGYRPREFSELLVLLMLIPILRLTPTILKHDNLKYPLYALFVLFLLNQFRSTCIDYHLLHRSILLIENIFGLTIFVFVLSPLGKSIRDIKGTWLQLFIQIIPVLTLIFIATIGFNFYGLIGLSVLLIDGIVIWLIFTILLSIGRRVIITYVNILLRTPIANYSLMVKNHKALLFKKTSRIFTFIFTLLWIYISLKVFYIWDQVIDSLKSTINDEWAIGSIIISLGDILIFLLVLVISIIISRFIKFLLEEEIFIRFKMSKGSSSTSSMLVKYFILFVGFLLAVAAAGIDLTALSFIGGALGVGIGFGLQSIVANFISGLIMAFERPVQIGDIVTVGTLMGTVQKIGLRASNVLTFDGAEVIVPNSEFITKEVINWTLTDQRRRLEIKVGVEYGTDPENVILLLNRILSEHENILDDPAPLVLYQGYGDSSLDFKVLFWVNENILKVPSDINLTIQKEFEKANIKIPFPTRTIITGKQEEPKAQTKETKPQRDDNKEK